MEKSIPSPINGMPMELKSQKRRFWYRDKRVEIDYHFYQCDSGERFESTEVTQHNLNQVYENYARIRNKN